MEAIIEGKLYNTQTASLVASDRYWDGRNWERRGRNTYLYRTPRGKFFLHNTTRWQEEHDTIMPVTREAAKQHYEALYQKEMRYQEAFGEEPEEA